MAKKTVVTKEEFSEGQEGSTEVEDEDEGQPTPLFDDIDRTGKSIDKVFVRRLEPASGYMGTLPPDITEQDIFNRWGGGEYQLQAKNAASRIVKARTVKIAGDPQFSSEAEEKRWRRMNGLEARASGPGATGESKMTDILLLLEEKEEKRRAEQFEREERLRKEQLLKDETDRRLRDDREMAMTRERDAREDRLRKDAEEREERRRREAKEDEERRSRLHREDMERIAAQNQTQLQQSQQFFQQLAANMQQGEKSDPVQTLLAGMQVAREMASPSAPGEGDFLTTLISKLPETLSEIRKTGSAAYQEISGRKAGRPAGVGPQEDFLTLTGPTATRAKAVLAKLAKEGKNPEVVINQLLTVAAGMRPSIPAAAPKTSGKKNGKTEGPKLSTVSDLASRARGAGKSAAPRRGRPRGSRNRSSVSGGTALRGGGSPVAGGTPRRDDQHGAVETAPRDSEPISILSGSAVHPAQPEVDPGPTAS